MFSNTFFIIYFSSTDLIANMSQLYAKTFCYSSWASIFIIQFMFPHLFQFWLLSIVLSSSLHHSLDKLLIFSLQFWSYSTFTSICPYSSTSSSTGRSGFKSLLNPFFLMCLTSSLSHTLPEDLWSSSSLLFSLASTLSLGLFLFHNLLSSSVTGLFTEPVRRLRTAPLPHWGTTSPVGSAGVSLLYINQLTSLCLICLYEWCQNGGGQWCVGGGRSGGSAWLPASDSKSSRN